ncbi:reverse transcriptase RNA-dependent DNA polymerase [Nitzschia inconspicua]|uniref:Reverse transcriptase RNA-dependent DNA polymerase n=1 Tax=Nitzschia inconspicua TaxID=303405 RepID=A0A9K3KHH9_9STRA|nr:reverse transcriptase RNA-dependent DNA polymerase [Nitzschia inconspicua]
MIHNQDVPIEIEDRITKFEYGHKLPRVQGEVLNNQRLATLNWNNLLQTCRTGSYGAFLTELQRNTVDGYVEEWNPALLATKANAEDHPDWDTAMNGPHAAGFWKACQTEYDTLVSKDVWEVVPRPKNHPVISGTWAFRIKRYPDGSMRKLKARFCARGFEQTEGVDYDETFAPVVNWTTVRFLLMMSILLGLETRQVDYVAAFVQADIDMDVYVEMPRGFSQKGKVLKLKKSLYGLKQSPRNYFNHLSSKLNQLGFTASDADPCLFVSDKCICLVYVDDTLLYARSQKDLDDVVKGLRDLNMDLEEESDVAGFLGVLVDRRPDGSIVLLQEGLIARIIEALQITHLHPKRTPYRQGVLTADLDGDPPNGTFNYASVVGMLGYLQANSRPDLSFAVAQCARFTHSPKRSHEEALERIGQYLKSTTNKGLILKPTPLVNTFNTDIYVDADFAGGWGYEDPSDPACVKSRTGFVIEIMGCPIQWLSKLQPNIATSTMEAEYTALSIALRAAIPLIHVIKFVNAAFGITQNALVSFKTTVHEDNKGALTLAQLEPGRQTPRSKFYAIKMHWFRSWLKPNEIEIQYIESKRQKADMFTKALPTAVFEENRKLSCGW